MVKVNIVAQCIKLRYALSNCFIRTKYMYIVTVPLIINEGAEGICTFKLMSLGYTDVTLKTQTGGFFVFSSQMLT